MWAKTRHIPVNIAPDSNKTLLRVRLQNINTLRFSPRILFLFILINSSPRSPSFILFALVDFQLPFSFRSVLDIPFTNPKTYHSGIMAIGRTPKRTPRSATRSRHVISERPGLRTPNPRRRLAISENPSLKSIRSKIQLTTGRTKEDR